MGKMWPSKLSPDILSDPGKRAELKVYEKLRTFLKDPFVVFYSRPWLGTTASGQPKDGECDFVVAHPDFGFLALEVKGGGTLIKLHKKDDVMRCLNHTINLDGNQEKAKHNLAIAKRM